MQKHPMHENSVCCLYYYITLISAYNVVSHENDDDGLVPQKTMAIIILKHVCVCVESDVEKNLWHCTMK